jgi:hypothetical protein
MAINPSGIKSVEVAQDTNVCIELLSTRPVEGATFSPAKQPGLLVGFYNGALDGVEIFVVDYTGTRYVRMV